MNYWSFFNWPDRIRLFAPAMLMVAPGVAADALGYSAAALAWVFSMAVLAWLLRRWFWEYRSWILAAAIWRT